jgi:hypothetical protein
MDIRWRLWRRQLSSGRLSQDELELIAVGDPDPTTDPGTAAHGYRKCRFEWADETSRTLTLPWSCTRQAGHEGQHLAGTGEQVAAVHPQLLPKATAATVAV